MWRWRTHALCALCALVALACAGLYFFTAPVHAATGVNQQLSFEGKIVKSDGTNITDGTYNVQFKIYQDGTGTGGGTLKWTENRLISASQGISFSSGTFQVNLGAVTAFGSSVDWNQDTLWLSIQVGNTSTCTITTSFQANCGGDGEMTPFIRLTATPYALNAQNANNLGGLSASQFLQLAPGTVQGDSSTNTSLFINKTGASGNILQLQKAGNPVFTVANDGTATASKLGVGISPTFALDVVGSINATTSLKIGGVDVCTASGCTGAGGGSSTLQAAYDGSTSPATISETAGKGIAITASAAPTSDMLSISNAGQGVTTAGANGLSVNYVGGAAAVESSGLRVDFAPGGTSGGTWSGIRIVANATGPVSGVTSYGLKLEGPTSPGAGTETAVKIANGWDIGLDVGSGGLQLSSMSDPATPAANSLRVFAQTRAGRTLLKIKGPSGVSTSLQPALFANKIGWWTAQGNGTTVSAININNTASGTATARNVATTNLFNSMRRIGYVSSTTAGSFAGTRNGAAQFWFGNGTGLGGFYYVARFGISQIQTGMRTYVGMSATTGAFSNADPSTLLNSIGFGCDSADTSFTFMHNNGSGTATKDTLTGSFPCNTANTDIYDARIFVPFNSSTVYYSLERLNTGDLFDGSTTTKIPTNTTLLSPQIWMTNNATAAAVGIDVVSQYIETDN